MLIQINVYLLSEYPNMLYLFKCVVFLLIHVNIKT